MTARVPCHSWLGHNYRPRFDTVAPVIPPGGIPYNPMTDDLDHILKRLTSFNYVCDICTRCGHVIPRSS